jgi:N-acetylmuramoyl-L-alanine amidase
MCVWTNIEILKIQRLLNRFKIYDEKGQKLDENGLISESYNFAIREFQRIIQVKESEVLRSAELIVSKTLIGLGDNNIIIKYLQWFLEINIDGKFDLKTEAQVIRFQNKKVIATDGIVGAETWEKIIG